MSEPNRPTANPKLSRTMLFAIAGAIALVFFLAGFLPMWSKAANCQAELREVRRQGVIVSLQNTLGSAVIDARRGQYEEARRQTSEFFTALRAQAGAGMNSGFNGRQRQNLAPLLAQRDDLITLLARADPASADRLTELYLAYRKALEHGANSG